MTPQTVSQKLTVLDTGAGPNVIKLDALPADVDIDAMPMQMDLRTASGAPLPTMGVINLYVKVGTYTCRKQFVVVDILSADVLLGATFIQQNVDNIWIRRRQLILTDGTAVPLQLRISTGSTAETVNYITLPNKVPETMIRIAKAT